MRSLLQNIPLVVIVFIVVSIVRAIKRAREQSAEHEATHDETDEQRRVREIQERIRRIAAERRGGSAPVTPPPLVQPAEAERRGMLQRPVPPLEPFGGPLKRTFEKFDRRPQPPPIPAFHPTSPAAELERQQRLADELRELQEAKEVATRRAAHAVAAEQARAQSAAGLRTAARARLLQDLRDPHALRRAFVLREVLGTPVGLR